MTASTAKKATAPAINPSAPENWEWEVVKEAAGIKVIFDTIGDTFIGQYVGKEYIQNDPSANGEDRSFWKFNFEYDGDLYEIGESFDLKEKMEDIDPGTWCRIEYIRDVPTARKQNPLKSFRISVRK